MWNCETVQVSVGISKPDSCKIVKQINLLPPLMLSVSLLASIFLKSKIKTRRIAREVLMVSEVGLDCPKFLYNNDNYILLSQYESVWVAGFWEWKSKKLEICSANAPLFIGCALHSLQMMQMYSSSKSIIYPIKLQNISVDPSYYLNIFFMMYFGVDKLTEGRKVCFIIYLNR